MAYWGYHAMLNCAGSDNRVSDRDNIIAFTKALVKNIDMKAYGARGVRLFTSSLLKRANPAFDDGSWTSDDYWIRPGIYYHGTTNVAAKTILQEGLSSKVVDRCGLSDKGYIYLTDTKGSAQGWAKAAANVANEQGKKTKPAIIQVQLSKELIKKLKPDLGYIGVSKGDYRLKVDTLPPQVLSLTTIDGRSPGEWERENTPLPVAMKSPRHSSLLKRAVHVYHGGNLDSTCRPLVTYWTTSREMAESYVDMTEDRQ